jgi:hypothetical protein
MVMFVAAWQGALHESLWFGQVAFGGFTLHPLRQRVLAVPLQKGSLRSIGNILVLRPKS